MHVDQLHSIMKTKQLILSFFEKSDHSYWILLNQAFLLADTGKHKNNYYHNTYHLYSVAKMCARYMTFDFTGSPRRDCGYKIEEWEQAAIFVAALLHDYGHYGESLTHKPDSKNISWALFGLDCLKDSLVDINGLTGFDSKFKEEMLPKILNLAGEAIASTEVEVIDGKLTFKECDDKNIGILRDADVTAVMAEYSQNEILSRGGKMCNGFNSEFVMAENVSRGLAREMEVPFDVNFQNNNIKFWESLTLYTSAANLYRQRELPMIKEYYHPTVLSLLDLED